MKGKRVLPGNLLSILCMIVGQLLYPGASLSYPLWDSARGPAPAAALAAAAPEGRPEYVESPSLAYDARRGVMVLYGSAHTWEYGAAAWQPVATPVTPELDAGRVMAYDSRRGVVVLAGLRENYAGETWEYDGAGWRFVTAYPLYSAAGAAYDAARGRVIAFGGRWCERPGCAYYARTWEYSGTTWVEAVTPHAPPARAGHALAYDPLRGVVVLFGGYGGAGATTYGDTWEYNGSDWRQVFPAHSPPPRTGAAMAYDARRQVAVLYGGAAAGDVLDDTWEYDGRDWRPAAAAPGPAGRTAAAMAYDTARGTMVLFGGQRQDTGGPLGDTWEYSAGGWNAVGTLPAGSPDAAAPYPYCGGERPAGAGPLYVLPVLSTGNNGCGAGEDDWYTLCCGCQGPRDCPASCAEPGGNPDLVQLREMKDRLGADHSGSAVRVGFSAAVFYLGWVEDAAHDFHFDENILRYILSVAAATNLPVLIHLNGQQWAGAGWPGYGQLTRALLTTDENNMHTNLSDAANQAEPWYDESRSPAQHISHSDIDLTSPDLDWILERDWQRYKERNLKEAICWLEDFRQGPQGRLLVGVSLDSEVGMSSLYASRPDLEVYAGDCGGVPCNYNPWDAQVAFDYADQFDYRGSYPVECGSSPSPQPQYCTGGMRHHFVDFVYDLYGGDLEALNQDMGTSFIGWWANHRFDSPDHLGDGFTVQNNPPLCAYGVPGHNAWECVYPDTPYAETWTDYRRLSVRSWVQRTADFVTCANTGDDGRHLWACPLADQGCTAGTAGFPGDMVFTHQAADPLPQDHFCSPIWTAQVDGAQVGLTTYDAKAASRLGWGRPYTTLFQDVAALADGQAGRGRWGLVEWNPIDWDCYDPGYEVHYQTLQNLYNCGAAVVCPYTWPHAGGSPCGGTDDYPYGIRDTQLEAAIHAFALAHDYLPCTTGYCHFVAAAMKNFVSAAVPAHALPGLPAAPAGGALPRPAGLPDYPAPTPHSSPTPTPTATPIPGDTTPPQSAVGPQPAYQASPSFPVTWSGRDDRSGVQRFDVQYRDGPAGPWTGWISYPIPFYADFPGAQEGHTYYLRSRAVDGAGNVEPWPQGPDYDAATTVDLTPPASGVAGLPPYSPADFPVAWDGHDGVSGVASYDVQVCVDNCLPTAGVWSDWLTATTQTGALFRNAQDGRAYYFRSRARDHAGNVEGWPADPDAGTRVDAVAPTSAVAALPPYSSGPITVTWSGADAGSGIASYDLQTCRVDCELPKMAVWEEWLTGVTVTQAVLESEETRVCFRSRARDRAGNEEPEHGQPDACTVVDLYPPDTRVDALPAYSQAAFTVTWGGWDSASGIVDYDVQYCAGDCDDPAAGADSAWTGWLTHTTAAAAAFPYGQHAQSYSFRSRARDLAGHLEPWPADPDTITVVDAVTPSSKVAALAPYSPIPAAVAWGGVDEGSGIVAYDVQVCAAPTTTPGCWVDWQVGTTAAAGLYTGTHGQAAAFRSRAYDAAGNREDYPAGPDAWTILDGLAPQTWFAASPGAEPYHIAWAGQDELSGLDHYDLYLRDEAAATWAPWFLGVTTTQAVLTGTAGHTYHLCLRGVDRAGNVEAKDCPAGLGEWPPRGEQTAAWPPTSRVAELPPIAPGATFAVRWAGTPGVLYDVQFRDAALGAWQDWHVRTPQTQALFTGTAGRTYLFRCRAVLADGTAEPWPWAHDAQTTVPGGEAAGPAPGARRGAAAPHPGQGDAPAW